MYLMTVSVNLSFFVPIIFSAIILLGSFLTKPTIRLDIFSCRLLPIFCIVFVVGYSPLQSLPTVRMVTANFLWMRNYLRKFSLRKCAQGDRAFKERRSLIGISKLSTFKIETPIANGYRDFCVTCIH